MSAGFDIVQNEFGQLILKRPGVEDVVDVRPRQSFPWSAGETMLSVRNKDGKEVILIQRMTDLPAAVRQRLDQWMAANSFLPEIRSIVSVNNDFGYQMWDVVTDRGPVKFRVQEREDVRFLPDGRFSVKDTDGNIYVMPPLHALSVDSRRAVRVML